MVLVWEDELDDKGGGPFMTQVSTLTKISTILSLLSSQSGLAGLYSPPSRAGDSLFPLRKELVCPRGEKKIQILTF